MTTSGWYLNWAAGPAAGGSGLGPRPYRRVRSVCPAYRQCALRVGVVSRPRLVRHDERLVPQLWPPGLRPVGPDSGRGPAGKYGVSTQHIGSAPCVWEWIVGLVLSVTTSDYLDWGRRACGRWVRNWPAALQVSIEYLPCMSAVRPACGSG